MKEIEIPPWKQSKPVSKKTTARFEIMGLPLIQRKYAFSSPYRESLGAFEGHKNSLNGGTMGRTGSTVPGAKALG